MLTTEQRDQLTHYLVLSEGLRLKPYRDTVGKLSIGIGRNLTDVGISRLEAHYLCGNDMDRAYIALIGKYPWFQDQDAVRQIVLTELCFNMGAQRLGLFVNTLKAFEQKDYQAAANGLRASKWFTQVQASRSSRIIHMTITGEYV